jgi:hypothetical protein
MDSWKEVDKIAFEIPWLEIMYDGLSKDRMMTVTLAQRLVIVNLPQRLVMMTLAQRLVMLACLRRRMTLV